MATGKQPFSGTTSAVIFEAILNKVPASPVLLNRGLPPQLENILNKALEKDRELRCQSAAELRADLKRLNETMIPPGPVSGERLRQASRREEQQAVRGSSWKQSHEHAAGVFSLCSRASV